MRKTVFSAKAIYSLYVIASALLSAISIILTEIIIQHYSTKPLIIILFGNLLASIIMLLISLITRKKRYPILASWKRQDWVAIIVTSLSTYGLAYLLSFDAVRQIGSSKTALLLLLETPFIVTLGIIFLQERLSFRQWIAFALALVGVVLITFDSSAFNLTLGWGEIEAILSGLSFAIGIVVIKPVLQKVDQFWLTSLLLFLGTVSLGILSPFFISSAKLGLLPGLLIAIVGLLRAMHWLPYNLALRHIGASRSAILYLSFSFFTVAIQVGVALLAPTLGLQLPSNLVMSISGGILITIGIILLETAKDVS